MSKITIAKGLSLPVDLVTQTTAILAKRRAGKSYLARKIAEEIHRAGQQLVIVDPKGDWWGIRSSADGRSPGLPITILGGERADVPLEPSAGEIVAKLAVEKGVSLLLDLSLLRKHQVATFMTAFLEQLYRLKAREKFRTPVMLIIDEADAIAPQRPQKGEERMLGAAEDIVRRGGQRGIGCTLVTQRAAVLNKNVLTQAQILAALRTIAPQDLSAMNAWIDVHGTAEERKTLMDSLPSLPIGDAWIWSPGWPTVEGVFERVHVEKISTFDSGATPKAGERRVEPKKVADVDLEVLRREMSETIARAKAEDPAELRKRIAELERELKKKVAPAPARDSSADVILREHKAISAAMAKARKKLEATVHVIGKGRQLFEDLEQLIRAAQFEIGDPKAITYPPELVAAARKAGFEMDRKPTPAPSSATTFRQESADGSLGKGERAILTVLAQYPHGKNRRSLGTLSGYTSSGGSFGTYVSRLRTKGLIEGSDTIRITAEGLAALGDFDPLPAGPELQDYWLGRLGKGEAAILCVLLEQWPNELSRQDLGELSGYEASGGSFGTYLSRLRTKELLDPDKLKASDAFFEER